MSTRNATQHSQWLARFARRERVRLTLAAGAGLITGGLIITQAGLIAAIIHGAVAEGLGIGELGPLFALLVAVVTARAAGQWAQQAAGIAAAAAIRQDLRAEVLDRIAAIGPVRLANAHSAGIASQALEQVDAVDGYFARYLPQKIVAVGVPLAILAVAVTQDWIVALLLLLAAPLIPLFMALVGMGAEHLNRQQFETVTRLACHFLDRVRGMSTLRLFGRGEDAVRAVAEVAEEYRWRNMRTLRVAFLSSAVLEFFAAVAIATVAIYVGFGLLGYIEFGNADELTLFSGLFVLLLAPEFFQPLRTLAQHYHDRAAALGATEGLRELLDGDGPSAPAQPATAVGGAARVMIDDVDFAHPGRSRILDQAFLAVEPGECVALTGPSGCGKSTLLQLLAGLIAPTRGRIDIDGREPGEAAPVAWVGQRPFLVAGTIASNIALARPSASREEIRAAAERARVTAFSDPLPEGLDTPLAEGGRGLSGGQGQRVAIARAFLAEAPLLLLDEPTASLDARAEAQVLEALQALAAAGATLVIASHHPAVHALMDRIVTFKQGRLVEVTAP